MITSHNFLLSVLIETYWNVKIDSSGIGEALQRSINRNILECKVISTGRPSRGGLPVLIETYWNVKTSIDVSLDETASY